MHYKADSKQGISFYIQFVSTGTIFGANTLIRIHSNNLKY